MYTGLIERQCQPFFIYLLLLRLLCVQREVDVKLNFVSTSLSASKEFNQEIWNNIVKFLKRKVFVGLPKLKFCSRRLTRRSNCCIATLIDSLEPWCELWTKWSELKNKSRGLKKSENLSYIHIRLYLCCSKFQ